MMMGSLVASILEASCADTSKHLKGMDIGNWEGFHENDTEHVFTHQGINAIRVKSIECMKLQDGDHSVDDDVMRRFFERTEITRVLHLTRFPGVTIKTFDVICTRCPHLRQLVLTRGIDISIDMEDLQRILGCLPHLYLLVIQHRMTSTELLTCTPPCYIGSHVPHMIMIKSRIPHHRS